MKSTPESKKENGSGQHSPGKRSQANNSPSGLGRPEPRINSQTRIYPKLEVGAANDPAEREADLAAEQVLRGGKVITGTGGAPADQPGALRMKANSAAQGGIAAPTSVESKINSKRGKGGALPQPLQQKLSHTFGTDFSGVSVHTDGASHGMNAELGAKAFTQGSDMFFGKGQYAPGTPAGDRLIAHEAAHVVQGGKSLRRKETEPAVLKKRHCVQPGETLKDIGFIYYDFLVQKAGGLDQVMNTQYVTERDNAISRVEHDLMIANNLSTPFIRPGQEILIPDLSYYGTLGENHLFQTKGVFHSTPPSSDLRYLGYFKGVPTLENTTQMCFVVSGTAMQWKKVLAACVLGLNTSVWNCYVEPFIRTAIDPNWIEKESVKKRQALGLPSSVKIGELKRGVNVSEIKEFLRALYGQGVDNSDIDFVNIKAEFPYLGSGKSGMQQFLDEFILKYQHYLVEEIARENSGGTLKRSTLMHFLDEGDDQVEMAVFSSAFASAVAAATRYVAITNSDDEPDPSHEKASCITAITASAEILRASVDNIAKDNKFAEDLLEIVLTVVFSSITHEDSETFEAIKNILEPILTPIIGKWAESGYDPDDEKNTCYREFSLVVRGFEKANLLAHDEYTYLMVAFNSSVR